MDFSRSAVLRRWYFVSIGLGFLALFILRLTVLGGQSAQTGLLQSLANITDNLLAAAVTALIVGIAYAYLYPVEGHASHEFVHSVDIADVIAEQTRTTRSWAVRSRGGNYFTTVTLADIVKSALTNGRAVSVRVQSIDPDNEALVMAYARSMSDIKSRVGTWPAQRARREVMASLLRAALQVRNAPRVEVVFGLAPHTWVMSLDVSDSAALVTCQNKGEDALLFRSTSPFYKSYCDDFDGGWLACRKVTPTIERDVPRDPADLTADDYVMLNAFFQGIGIAPASDQELQEIVRVLDRKTDYD